MRISIRNLVFIISLVFLSLSNTVFAAETLKNTGLIQSNIWYSKDPFSAGDKVRIYSIIFNGSNKDLKGRVNFYDNGFLLCTSEFASLAGRINEVWCDWLVAAGKHTISLKIVNPRASSPGEEERPVVLGNSEFQVDERTVELPKKETENSVASHLVNEGEKEAKTGNIKSPAADKDQGFLTEIKEFFTKDILSGGDGLVVNLANKLGYVGSTTGLDSEAKVTTSLDNNRVNGYGRSPISQKLETVGSKEKTVKALGSGKMVDRLTWSKEGDNSTLKESGLERFYTIYFEDSIASVRDKFLEFINRSSLLTFLIDISRSIWSYTFVPLRDTLLSWLQKLSNNDTGPLSYLIYFLYVLLKFLLNSAIVIGLLSLYIIWKLIRILRGQTYS